MPLSRRVFLDPSGTIPYLLGVVIAHPTGVCYEQQCAGTETNLRSIEGYFVPLGGLRFVADKGLFDPNQLTEVFHEGNACTWGGRAWNLPPNASELPEDRLERLRSLVEAIPYWTESDQRLHLRVDEERLGELVEAWVPVLTPDGPGVLVWENCD